MVRTFALVVALVAVPAAIYAQNLRGFEPLSYKHPAALAGQVNADGSVARGSHFTVTHVAKGEYQLDFDETYFRSSCPIVTITALAADAIYGVVQGRCRTYYAYFKLANNGDPRETAFDLIAVAPN